MDQQKALQILAGLAAWTAGAYVLDVILLPALVARQARREADARGKPLLNIGAGTSGSSLRSLLLGPTLWGDVNLDIAAPKDVLPGPNVVSWGDAHRLPYPDNYFGATVSSHMVEHVDNPQAALCEMQRVTEGTVYAIVPKWWAPHTWFYTDHQWFVSTGGTAYPLWTEQSECMDLTSCPVRVEGQP